MMPHQLIEGIVIAGRAVGSHQGYVYVRGEYRYVLDILDVAVAEAYQAGYLGKNILGSGFDFDLVTHTGAGAYEDAEKNPGAHGIARGQTGLPAHPPAIPRSGWTLWLTNGD